MFCLDRRVFIYDDNSIMDPNKLCVTGCKVVVDPFYFFREGILFKNVSKVYRGQRFVIPIFDYTDLVPV